ncbi:hypothetical protein [Singapore grouper iridovirus]|nr:hypothetical protein [Singapore grouper iridovirus]
MYFIIAVLACVAESANVTCFLGGAIGENSTLACNVQTTKGFSIGVRYDALRWAETDNVNETRTFRATLNREAEGLFTCEASAGQHAQKTATLLARTVYVSDGFPLRALCENNSIAFAIWKYENEPITEIGGAITAEWNESAAVTEFGELRVSAARVKEGNYVCAIREGKRVILIRVRNARAPHSAAPVVCAIVGISLAVTCAVRKYVMGSVHTTAKILNIA